MTQPRDGREWRIGTAADVEWIERATNTGLEITSAIPPVFEAYATIVIPDLDEELERRQHNAALLRRLGDRAADQSWVLGFLDTGGSDAVFPAAPRVQLYANWSYVLVDAGVEQARCWRDDAWRPLPDVMFPLDRSWLVSRLWDDDWWCFGGPAELVRQFRADPAPDAREVPLGVDATPPGFVAR